MQDEEQLVHELARLGVGYLSRKSTVVAQPMHAPHELLAKLVCQPSSRVRIALIALLLARPDYARHVRMALKSLNQTDAQRLRFYYSAAVILQQQYAKTLRTALGVNWRKLPDLFAGELGITGDSPAIDCKNWRACRHNGVGKISIGRGHMKMLPDFWYAGGKPSKDGKRDSESSADLLSTFRRANHRSNYYLSVRR